MHCHVFKSIIGATVVALGATVGAAMAADEPGNIIKYRQATMKAIGGHMGALGAMAKGEVSFTDEAMGHAHAINEMSKNLARLFPEGTGKGDTDVKSIALPAIWEKTDEFQAAVKGLQDESAQLIVAAESGDPAAFGQQVGALGKNGCGTCHKAFREEK